MWKYKGKNCDKNLKKKMCENLEKLGKICGN